MQQRRLDTNQTLRNQACKPYLEAWAKSNKNSTPLSSRRKQDRSLSVDQASDN